MAPVDLLLLLGLGLLWGASFMFIKVVVLEMSPVALAAFRLGLGSAGLLLFTWRSAPGLRSSLGPSLVLSLFGAVIPYLLIAWGELHITSGGAAILNATSPLFSAVLSRWSAFWTTEERLGAGGGLGLLLGLAGVAVLVGGSTGFQLFAAGGAWELLGFLAVLAASASYAVGGLYARRAFVGQPFTVPALGQNLVGAVALLPVALTFSRPAAWPSPAALASLLCLGLGGTALAYLLYYRLISRVGATRTLSVTYLLPATALVYGAVLLGEQVTIAMLLGLGLILTGVALVTGVAPRRR